ncbi:MAG: thiamine pyrophosphate-binding protein [Oligoflexia bacterium]|nr:thiamine pyrophosphate-binding protein [Oligoflexia bacterium]
MSSTRQIRVSDYIIQHVYAAGAKDAFLVTGGMIMHLTDAILNHKEMKFYCCQHEQAATMAAEAYGRYNNRLGLVVATAGPGALNTITGVVGAYVDRSPLIILAGQAKVSQAIVSTPRQFALQGFNNIPIFKNITKYSVILTDISKVKYEVEKAIHMAQEAPVGPVYIECPIDIQGATFNPDQYEGFTPVKEADPKLTKLTPQTDLLIDDLVNRIKQSKRPMILAGAGVRLSNSINLFHKFIELCNMPALTSRLGMDLIEHDHPLFVGRPGTYGDRPANFTIQNCDLFITVGCRLGIGIVGYGDPKLFAPHAYKVAVDVDEKEINKPSVKFDCGIVIDAKIFFEKILEKLGNWKFHNLDWVSQTQNWKKRYPVDLPEYKDEKEGMNSYRFTRLLSEKMSEGDTFLVDTGSCFHVFAQSFQVKKNQRHIITGGLSTMGYSPASIGVAVAHARESSKKDVFCISGDGSIQMNLQEFSTIAHYKLPIKTIIYNNNGYLLIRHTQKNFCAGRLIGESKETGVGFPDLSKIAYAYGIHHIKISNESEFNDKIDELIHIEGPVICEVMNPAWQLLIPRVSSKQLEDGSMVSMPYDDMFPFLDRKDYENNCLWKN